MIMTKKDYQSSSRSIFFFSFYEEQAYHIFNEEAPHCFKFNVITLLGQTERNLKKKKYSCCQLIGTHFEFFIGEIRNSPVLKESLLLIGL